MKVGKRADPVLRAAEDKVIKTMSTAGVEIDQIAKAIGRSKGHVVARRKAIGCARATIVRDLVSLPGEVWKDRPDLGLKVSSAGRIACLRSNRLKAISRNDEDRSRGAAGYVTCTLATGQKATKRVEALMLETFAKPRPLRLRAASTFTGRGSVPTRHTLWTEARRAVSYGLPHDVQDDLISDIVLMRLEGFSGSATDAMKTALRSHSAMRGTFTETSLDAPLPGHSDLTLLDLIASDHDHF